MNLRGDGRRYECADRQSFRHALAHSEDETARGVIGNTSTLSGRDNEPIVRSRSTRPVPGRVATPIRAISRTRSGRVQAGNETSSSAPIRKTGSSRSRSSSDSTVRAKGSSDTSTSRIGANASSASARRICGAVSTTLCPGSATTRTSSRPRAKWPTASRARARCPLCGGSKAPPRIPTRALGSRSPPLTARSGHRR